MIGLVDGAVRMILLAMSAQIGATEPGVQQGAANERAKAAHLCLDAIAEPAAYPLDALDGAPEGAGLDAKRWAARAACSQGTAAEVVKVYADGSVLVRLTPAP